MTQQKIIEHEDWQPQPLEIFIAVFAQKNGWTNLPDRADVRGEVTAYINHGRWVVDCPDIACNSALVVSTANPVFLCPDCLNDQLNGAKWAAVVFPDDRLAIEKMLLYRPASNPAHAQSRNWLPAETLADLRKENEDHSLPTSDVIR